MAVVKEYTSSKEMLGKAIALGTDEQLDETNNGVGEPGECALVNYSFQLEMHKEDLKKEFVRIGEAPFDSLRKMMSTVHQTNTGTMIQYTKGAPDEILKCCTMIWDGKNALELTAETRKEIELENGQMASKALRVLAAAYRIWDSAPSSFYARTLEDNLIFIGLVGMIDPIRPEVKTAISECKLAGIKPIMITGDHKDTAVAIAMDLGIILNERMRALTRRRR